MWIVRLALRRPYTVAVLALALLLLGGLSLSRMRVDILPAINIPVVIVVWNYPGLSAEEMERKITYISERATSTSVSGVARIESQSTAGIGIVKIYFEEGADIGGAIAQVSATSQTLLRALPPGTQAPSILRYNAANVPVAQMTLFSNTLGEQQIFDYGLNFLRLRLFTIPGLATPAPFGGKSRQIMVDIDPAAAAAKGMSPQDVVTALLQSNVILPAGQARIGDTEYDVGLNASPDVVAQFERIPLRVVNGVTVFLGDVAHVRDAFAVQQNVVRVDGRRASYLAILKLSNASTLAVVDTVREMLPSLRAAAPNGMEIRLDFDQSLFVRAAIKGVLREGLIAAALVSVMILFFLGSWRSMVVVCTSIPLAICAAIVGLFLAGQSVDVMSLGGLALAIGMLVDDATVEVENIHRNRAMGKPLTVAILDGAHQIATPALAATLTICIVFFPVAMLEGPAKYLFIPLALSVVFAMMASYLLSRTLVPSMARMLLEKEEVHAESQTLTPPPQPTQSDDTSRALTPPPQPTQSDAPLPRERGTPGRRVHPGGEGHREGLRERMFGGLQTRYQNALGGVLAARGFAIVVFLVLLGASGALLTAVGTDFFPSVDTGQMRLHFRAPPGTRIERTEELVDAVEQHIRRIIPAAELSTINDNIGVPTFYNLAFVQTDNVGGWDAEILIALKENHHPTEEYVRRIRAELPGAFPGSTFYFQSADLISQVLNFGLSAPIDVQVESRDWRKAYEIAERLREKITHVPGAVDVRIAQVIDRPAFQVNVDRERAAQMGLTERDVANSMLTTLSSSILVSPSFWTNPETGVNYPVVVQTPPVEMKSLADLMSTPVTPGLDPIRAGTSTNGAANPPFATVGGAGLLSATTPATSPVAAYLGSIADVHRTQNRASINHYTVQPVIDVQCSPFGRDLGGVASDVEREIASLGKLPPGLRVVVRGQSESMNTSFRSLGFGLLLAVALVYLLMVVLFQSWIDPLIIIFAVPGALAGILWMLALTGTTLNVESMMGSIMAVGIAVSNSILLVSFANEVRAADPSVSALEAARRAGATRLRPVLMTALAMILGMLPMALAMGEGGEQNAPLGRAVIGGLLLATVVTLFIVPVVYSLLRRSPPRAHQLDEQFALEARGSAHGTGGA